MADYMLLAHAAKLLFPLFPLRALHEGVQEKLLHVETRKSWEKRIAVEPRELGRSSPGVPPAYRFTELGWRGTG